MAEKRRILLVDDEPGVLKTVGKRLEVEGFEVLIGADGQEALQKARTEAPDLIVLDLMLPKLSGFEVCAMVKQDPRYQHIPVIMLTARAQAKDAQLGLECGANAYLTKPFAAPELLQRIRELLPAPAAQPKEPP